MTLIKPPLRHRPEIDGLRAIAILVLLLLHCGVAQLRGGFAGVDVFFVISGYLITAIIERERAEGRFTLAGFYRRRVLRILPALVVMVAVVLVAGCLWLFPNRLADLGRSAVAVALFASNLWFWQTSDYFAQASDVKPLVHTWSRAGEEQFYLAYPLLLAALHGRTAVVKRAVIGAVAAVSLAVGAWQGLHAGSAGFFLLPARVWELALGALVALGAVPAMRAAAREALALAGLGLIVGAAVVVRPGWAFPVPWALPAALGAALVLAYGAGTRAGRILSLPPLRALGVISFSLYLWHRPIITAWFLMRGITVSPLDIAALVALSLIAATLSYTLIERPFLRLRHAKGGQWAVAGLLAGLALVGLAGGVIAQCAGSIRPLPPAVARVAEFEGFDATPAAHAQFSTNRCFTVPTGADFDPACLIPATDRPNLLLMGDSHGAQLSQALRSAFPHAHLMQATAAGCRPLPQARGEARCVAIGAQVYGGAVDLRRVARVILAARWLPDEDPGLLRAIAFFRTRGVQVSVVGPVVEYDIDEATLLARAMLAGDPGRIGRVRLADRAAYDRALGPKVRAAGATYVSAQDVECPEGQCWVFAPDGGPWHFDHSHFTPAAAAALVAARRAAFAP